MINILIYGVSSAMFGSHVGKGERDFPFYSYKGGGCWGGDRFVYRSEQLYWVSGRFSMRVNIYMCI